MPVADSSVPHIGVAKSQIFERKLSYDPDMTCYDLTWVSQNASNLMMSDVTSCIIWWNLMTKLWLLFQFQFIVAIHEMEKAMREGRCVTECRSHLTGKSRCHGLWIIQSPLTKRKKNFTEKHPGWGQILLCVSESDVQWETDVAGLLAQCFPSKSFN